MACVARWYAEPLSEADGASPDDVRVAEARLGVRLPAIVREWHLLVGRRLRPVQDVPARLEDLTLREGRVPLWFEGEDAWRIEAAVEGGDEAVEVGYGDARAYGPVREAVLAMVISDTLVGAWFDDERMGPLGELGADVAAGRQDLDDDAFARLRDAYGVIGLPQHPFFRIAEDPHRGDRETYLRSWQGSLEWMTATAAARARLEAIVGELREGA